ncbi:MAG: MATE family efflux transporter [Oscillibacter sp.]|nr:MATE family efflux transporter [Oscillibacter sp.]
MNSRQQDLTQGPLGRQILFFSLPLIFSNVLQVLFNMADVAVVGRFAGPAALGSVGSTTTLVTLFTGFLIGLGGGVNVLTALHLGARDTDALRQTVHSAAILCALAGLLLTGVGVAFARPILELLHTKDELIDGAALYLRIYFLGMPALGLYNFGNAVFSAAGDTRRPLVYLTAAGLVNLGLNLFFVLVCGMDVDGVAVASVISQYISAILIVRALFRAGTDFALRPEALRLHPGRSRAILTLGIPAGVQYGIFALANLFIQAAVNSFSATMVEGNSAAANADGIIYNVMAAFYTACSSFIGQNYGAGKRQRIRCSYFLSIGYAFGAGLALGVLLLALGPQFLSLFTKDALVVEAGMSRLRIMCLSYGFSAFMDGTIAASRGLEKSGVPTVMVILGSCVFRILWIYTVFAHFRTISSLYLLYIFSWAITAAAEIWYFARIYRQCMAHLPPTAETAPQHQPT